MKGRSRTDFTDMVSLAANQFVTFHRVRTDRDLACIAGLLWITFDGDRNDYILREGERLPSENRKRAVIYALRDSTFRFKARRVAARTITAPLSV